MAGIRLVKGTMPDTRLPLRMAANIQGPIRQGPTGLISIRPPVIQLVNNTQPASNILLDSILAVRIHKGSISRDRVIPAGIRLANTHQVGTRAINTRWASIPAISILAGSIRRRVPCPGPTRACPRAGTPGQCPTAGEPTRYRLPRIASWQPVCSVSFWAALVWATSTWAGPAGAWLSLCSP